MRVFSLLFVLSVVLCVCASYRLLAVFPFPSVSHGILGEAMVKPLLEDGHEITYITSSPLKNPPANLTQVDVSSLFSLLKDFQLTITVFMESDLDTRDYNFMLPVMHKITREALMHENVQKLLHDPDAQFDLVIAEWMYSETYAGFSAVFNCPYIWSSSLDPHWMVLRLIDESPNPAYVSDAFSENIPPFDFFQRIIELFTWLKVHFIWMTQLNAMEQETYTAAFKSAAELRGHTLPPLDVVKYNASLMFGNSHASTGMAVKVPQNYKPIGGYHIDEKIEPLPADLKKIMDKSKHGVIYFSMGSVMKGKDMPNKLRDDLIQMFATLNETVIWKFEDKIENLPNNVHVTKWAPQKSILAHPNTKIFITHGGLLSTTEAVCFGVPIIGVPGFADQTLNVNRAVMKGFAMRVNLDYDLPKNLKIAINEVIINPKYKETAKFLSTIFHSRPVSPRQELKTWTRHVIETRGAHYLRSMALYTPLYEKLYLDFVGVVLVFLGIVWFLVMRFMNINLSAKKSKLA